MFNMSRILWLLYLCMVVAETIVWTGGWTMCCALGNERKKQESKQDEHKDIELKQNRNISDIPNKTNTQALKQKQKHFRRSRADLTRDRSGRLM